MTTSSPQTIEQRIEQARANHCTALVAAINVLKGQVKFAEETFEEIYDGLPYVSNAPDDWTPINQDHWENVQHWRDTLATLENMVKDLENELADINNPPYKAIHLDPPRRFAT